MPSSSVYPDCSTLADVLQQVAERHPDRSALVDRGRTFAFAELERDVEALAADLHGHGGQPGAACALLMDNIYEHVVAWFAVQRAGLVLVPVNATLAPPEVAHQIADAQARLVIVSPALAGKLTPTAGVKNAVDEIVVLDSWQQDAVTSMSTFLADVTTVRRVDLSSLPSRHHRATVSRTDPAVIWYTSGTTGHPKGWRG